MGFGRRAAVVGWRLLCIDEVRRRLGFGGDGARFAAGIRDRFSTLAAGPSRPLIGELGWGERVEDADTKVSSDEAELVDVRLVKAGPADSPCSIAVCTTLGWLSNVVEPTGFGSRAAGLADGFVTNRMLSTVGLGRTAEGCRLGFGPSLLGSGKTISVAARRTICGGVFSRSGTGCGLGLGFGAGRAAFGGAAAGLSRSSPAWFS